MAENDTTHVYLSFRPFLREFIQGIAPYMDVVVFTASQKEYADKVIGLIDPTNKLIRHRLYRDSCTLSNGFYVKDLWNLNRDMKKIVIVDNSPISLIPNIENSILIRSYEGDPNDSGLMYLLHALKSICMYEDLREGIKVELDN